MANLITSVETVAAPAASGGRKPRIWRRANRTRVKKLLRAINVIQNADNRAEITAFGGEFNPLLFIKARGSNLERWLNAIKARCLEALAETR